MSPSDQLIFDTITDAANNGKPCPTNIELAAIVGFLSGQSAGDVLRRLEKAGLITVSRIQNGRMVKILATGQQIRSKTYEEAERKHVVRRPIAVEYLPPVTYRDPCPRCGVRADHGCGHGWTGEYFRLAA
ncbi:hypothetical protein [Sphingomonas sp. PB4P5]|uniref:hypothetical protein n=1 Tax=Parasphingomonas puruogangriensis TaxID=3096155 RepID=UPI002FCB8643